MRHKKRDFARAARAARRPENAAANPATLRETLTFIDDHLRVMGRILSNTPPELFPAAFEIAQPFVSLALTHAQHLLEGIVPIHHSIVSDAISDVDLWHARNKYRRVLHCVEWFSLRDETRDVVEAPLVTALIDVFVCAVGVADWENLESDDWNVLRCRNILVWLRERHVPSWGAAPAIVSGAAEMARSVSEPARPR